MPDKRRRKPRAGYGPRTDIEPPHPWAFLGEWRTSRGLTLEDVANALETSLPRVHRWEKGSTRLPVEVLIQLAALYKAEHPSDLSWPPSEARENPATKAATELAERMSPEALHDWMALGRRLVSQNGETITEEPPEEPPKPVRRK